MYLLRSKLSTYYMFNEEEAQNQAKSELIEALNEMEQV
jgi:hypothetical protein